MSSQLIEQQFPNMRENGFNTNVAATFGGTVNTTVATNPTGGIGAAGGFATSPRLVHTGSVPAQNSTDGTDATPATTETYICELFIPANMSVTGISLFNGSATGSGNTIVALANSSGVVVAQSASTAVTGTDSYQRIPFTAPYSAVGPATYYTLSQYNNTTTRYNTHTFGDFGQSKKTSETFGTFTTITPPTTFTTALGNFASLY